MKGCVPQFEKWLQDNLTLVAGIFIGVALLQVGVWLYLGLGLCMGFQVPPPLTLPPLLSPSRSSGFVWRRTW